MGIGERHSYGSLSGAVELRARAGGAARFFLWVALVVGLGGSALLVWLVQRVAAAEPNPPAVTPRDDSPRGVKSADQGRSKTQDSQKASRPATDDPSTRSAPDREQAWQNQFAPFFKKHCWDCHGADVQEGDVRLDQYRTAAAVAADTATWQRVIQMIRSGAMPPEDAPQPSEAQRHDVVRWLEETIYQLDCSQPVDPGRVTIRRLNRAEYNRTVRDLVGVTFRPADDFPSDDVGGGFDNLADVLNLPPLLMEKYLAAAERIAEEVIVTDPSVFVKSQFRFREQLRGEGSARYDTERRRWNLTGAGSVGTNFDFPREGEYVLRVLAAVQGTDQPIAVELLWDGQPLQTLNMAPGLGGGRLEVRVRRPAGQHRVGIRLARPDMVPAQEGSGPAERSKDSGESASRGGQVTLVVSQFEVDGPVDVRWEDYPPQHRRLVAVRPEAGRTVRQAAEANLRPLLLRAFRRPPEDGEVAQFVRLVEQAVEAGDSFEQGMQVALTAVLVSPHFLFRIESDAPPPEGGRVRWLNDYELATRLSYFLWSSLPDDTLFALAAAGKLRDEAVLAEQVQRMLRDPRSDALVENFVAQWLNLRLLENVTPDPQVFPQFDEALKASMRRETELFAAEIIQRDLSVLEFLQARWSFLDARLARHYGLADFRGSGFERVEFSDGRHAGVLTQASILTLTSNPGRTSPVKRGKWILENLLGSPPPDPPPDAPDLEATQKNQPDAPLRKQLEIHRQNPVCASCHKVMDQLGFGLENFDAIGRWRDRDGRFPIDASGELPGGARFEGPQELAGVLLKRRNEFARCLTEKMLTYALGRELVVSDRCVVDKIVDELAMADYRFSRLVTAIVLSDPFRKRRIDGGAP